MEIWQTSELAEVPFGNFQPPNQSSLQLLRMHCWRAVCDILAAF